MSGSVGTKSNIPEWICYVQWERSPFEAYTSQSGFRTPDPLSSVLLVLLFKLGDQADTFSVVPFCKCGIIVSAARFGLDTLISRFQTHQHITDDSRVALTNCADRIFSLKCLSFVWFFFLAQVSESFTCFALISKIMIVIPIKIY